MPQAPDPAAAIPSPGHPEVRLVFGGRWHRLGSALARSHALGFQLLGSSRASLFQTGWFVESLTTQTLIIHVIRTNKIPFLQSRASWPLMLAVDFRPPIRELTNVSAGSQLFRGMEPIFFRRSVWTASGLPELIG